MKDKLISIAIINTGGTFNKEYNEIKGSLDVCGNNKFIEDILQCSKIKDKTIHGILYKDSLDITDTDREELVSLICTIKESKILLIHGTDTMDKTAEFLAKNINDKVIVITGAMKPFSIDPIEATSNFMLGFGYLQASLKNGVYIAMHGMVKEHMKIKKNKEEGIFECLN